MHRYSITSLPLLIVVFESLTRITKAEYKEANQNEDIVYTIYTMFVATAESHSSLLAGGLMGISVDHRRLYGLIMDEMISCTNKPGIYPLEESCSSLAMGFWYMLQEEIVSSDVCASARTEATEAIKPIYAHLAMILVHKAQQPDDLHLEQWSSEDLETFRCYRQDISDTMVRFIPNF